MADILVKRLEDEMKKQGFNYKSLSRAAGLGETSVRDIITRRAANPRRDTLQKIAARLGRPLSYFLAEEYEAVVRVAGEIGAQAKIVSPKLLRVGETEQPSESLDRVEMPPELGYRDLVALRVKGDALMPFMPSGTLLYYCATDESRESCLDGLCVVQVKDGAAMVRTLKRGVLYGRYHLQDASGSVTENVDVEWCARIRFIKLP